MHRLDKNLFVRRAPGENSVQFIATLDGNEPEDSNILFEQTLSAGVWCEVLCAVSDKKRTELRWFDSMAFHGHHPFTPFSISDIGREDVAPSKAEAQRQGMKSFIGPSQCKRNHLPLLRRMPNGACPACILERNKTYYEKAKDTSWIQPGDTAAEEWVLNYRTRRDKNSKAWEERNPRVTGIIKKSTLGIEESGDSIYFRRKKRRVAWADGRRIQEIYDSCRRLNELKPRAFHVDHLIPLLGELVSGLHVHWNLRIISGTENCSKGNRLNLDDLSVCIDFTAEYYIKGWTSIQT